MRPGRNRRKAAKHAPSNAALLTAQDTWRRYRHECINTLPAPSQPYFEYEPCLRLRHMYSHLAALMHCRSNIRAKFPLDTRSFLLQDDLLEDSDDDSEFEDNLLEEELERNVKEEDKITLGGIKSEEKAKSEHLREKAIDDDGMDEYEAAASLRRRKNIGKHDSQGTESKTENEKDAQEDVPPTALQSERSVQDSLSGELLRMAGIQIGRAHV